MDKLTMHTPNLADENYAKLAALFPNAVTEAIDPETGEVVRAIDKDVLMQEINTHVVEGREERYQFTWPDKRKAVLAANAPISAALRPVRADSVGKDGTPGGWDSENLYIEGDNLDVLKLLRETYLGKVKMIYIDPPYNTGNDFVYEDDFAEETDSYMARSGQYDEQGNRLTQNTESNGRFHTDWLNMMYPRLRVAKDLLAEDGVIFISIDDSELENLKKICNEVFGITNFVVCLVYDKNRKNDAKYFSVGHEYMLAYFKNITYIKEMGIVLRASKEGVEEVREEFIRLREEYGDDWKRINEGLKKLYSSWPAGDPRRALARFSKVDEKGPYRDDGNINWPGGGGPMYDVIHPKTGKLCKKPVSGWRYSTLERLQEEIDKGHVVFGPDETTVPRVRLNLFEQNTEVMRSVHFSYAQTTTNEFNKLFDGKRVFENPKSISDIKQLIEYVTGNTGDDIILDFFSGSATTAHAVMQLNAEDGGHRQFIMVQLPEMCDEKSEAYKAGYQNICEIGKERIRRAGRKIKEACEPKPLISFYCFDPNDPNYGKKQSEVTSEGKPCPDIGFRVLRLDSSNMQDVYYNPAALTQSMLDMTTDNIKPDRTPEDLLFQVMLELGVLPSSEISETTIDGHKVFDVADGFLLACFDAGVTTETVTAIAKRHPYYAVFRDSSLQSDSVAANFEQIFEAYSPSTVRKVL